MRFQNLISENSSLFYNSLCFILDNISKLYYIIFTCIKFDE